MYKVIGAVIYTIIENYICLDYLGLLQDKLSKHKSNVLKIKSKNFSGLGISEILMNIISCYGFSKFSTSTVILIYLSDVGLYYPSNDFFRC